MKRWVPRQLIALILGVVFALGTVVSAVQAADMVVEMSTAAVMGAAMAPDDCGAACGGDDEASGTGSCVMACPASFQAAIGSASCRERVWSHVEMSEYAVYIKKTK